MSSSLSSDDIDDESHDLNLPHLPTISSFDELDEEVAFEEIFRPESTISDESGAIWKRSQLNPLTLRFASPRLEHLFCERLYGNGQNIITSYSAFVVVGGIGFLLMSAVDLLNPTQYWWAIPGIVVALLTVLGGILPSLTWFWFRQIERDSGLSEEERALKLHRLSSCHTLLVELCSFALGVLVSSMSVSRYCRLWGSGQNPASVVELLFAWLSRCRVKVFLVVALVNLCCYAAIPMTVRGLVDGWKSNPPEGQALPMYFVLGILIFLSRYVAEKMERQAMVLQMRLEKDKERFGEEASRARRLLHNILPRFFVAKIQQKKENENKNEDTNFYLHSVDHSTVILADLAGFTEFASGREAREVILRLNHIYSAFDFLTTLLRLEKATTIGDAFLAYGMPGGGREKGSSNLTVDGKMNSGRNEMAMDSWMLENGVLLGVGMIASLQALYELEFVLSSWFLPLQFQNRSSGVLNFRKKRRSLLLTSEKSTSQALSEVPPAAPIPPGCPHLHCRVGVYSGHADYAIFGSVSTSLSFEVMGEALKTVKLLEARCPVDHVLVQSCTVEKTREKFVYDSLPADESLWTTVDLEEDDPLSCIQAKELRQRLSGLIKSMEQRVRDRKKNRIRHRMQTLSTISSLDSVDEEEEEVVEQKLVVADSHSRLRGGGGGVGRKQRNQSSPARRRLRQQQKRKSCTECLASSRAHPRRWFLFWPSKFKILHNPIRLEEMISSSIFFLKSVLFHLLIIAQQALVCVYFASEGNFSAFTSRLTVFSVYAFLIIQVILILLDLSFLSILYSCLRCKRPQESNDTDTVGTSSSSGRRLLGIYFAIVNSFEFFLLVVQIVFIIVDYDFEDHEVYFETFLAILLLYMAFIGSFSVIRLAIIVFELVVVVVHEVVTVVRLADWQYFLPNLVGGFLTAGLVGLAAYYLDYLAVVSFEAREDIVLQKVRLKEERDKSNRLILSVLPKRAYTEALNRKRTFESLECCVVFLEIAGFDTFFEKASLHAVEILANLYYSFDAVLADEPKAMKIKTVQEVFLFIALPDDEDDTYFEIPRVVEKLFRAFDSHLNVNLEDAISIHIPDFGIRCGAAHGNVAAGILGKRRFLYDIIGDCANVASRLCSTGKHRMMHVLEESVSSFVSLENPLRFVTELRGRTFLKGKGEVNTADMYLPNEQAEKSEL